jgi:hypothetical protein
MRVTFFFTNHTPKGEAVCELVLVEELPKLGRVVSIRWNIGNSCGVSTPHAICRLALLHKGEHNGGLDESRL